LLITLLQGFGGKNMTREEFRVYVRSLLAEPFASYWADNELDVYIDFAKTDILNELWYLLYKTYNKKQFLSVIAGQDLIDLPADCLKVISIKLASNPEETFDFIPEDVEEYYEQNKIPGWRFEEGKIKINPTPTSNMPNYLKIKYLPNITFENLPECLYPLLGVRTVIQAKVKDEQVPVYLLRLEQQYKDNAITFLVRNQLQNEDCFTE